MGLETTQEALGQSEVFLALQEFATGYDQVACFASRGFGKASVGEFGKARREQHRGRA